MKLKKCSLVILTGIITTFNAHAFEILEINDQIKLKVTLTQEYSFQKSYTLEEDFVFENDELKLNVPKGECLIINTEETKIRGNYGRDAIVPANSYSFSANLDPDFPCFRGNSMSVNLGESVQVNINKQWHIAFAYFNSNMQLTGADFSVEDVYVVIPTYLGVKFSTELQPVKGLSINPETGNIYYRFTNFYENSSTVNGYKLGIVDMTLAKKNNGQYYVKKFWTLWEYMVETVTGQQLFVPGYGDCQIVFNEDFKAESFSGSTCRIQ